MGRATANEILEGKTLEVILNELVEYCGWDDMGREINIRCFNENPSVKSSLTFLRKTPWARSKVEWLYIQCMREKKRHESQL
jgi:uncharacterized protein (DUF2132 family)